MHHTQARVRQVSSGRRGVWSRQFFIGSARLLPRKCLTPIELGLRYLRSCASRTVRCDRRLARAPTASPGAVVCCQPGRGLPRTPDANSTPACVRLNDADEPQLFRWPSRGELPEGKSPKLGRGTFRQGRAARKKPSPSNRREARHKRRGPPSVRPAVFHAYRPAPPLWQGSQHAAARWGTLRPPRHTAETGLKT